MAVLTAALDTPFTPVVGDFIAQVTGGSVTLIRKNNAGAAYALVQSLVNQAVVVSNPIAGAVYQFASTGVLPAPVVSADQ